MPKRGSRGWDETNRRRKALDHYLDVTRRECAKLLNGSVVAVDDRHVVTHSFQMCTDLSKIAEWPRGLDFESEGPLTVRSWISGTTGRIWLLENWQLWWRAVRGQGIQWTMNHLLGETWLAYMKLATSQDAISLLGAATDLAMKIAPTAQKNTFKKLVFHLDHLGDELSLIAARIKAELPQLERPVLEEEEPRNVLGVPQGR